MKIYVVPNMSNTPTIVTDIVNEDKVSAEQLFVHGSTVSSQMQATFDAIYSKETKAMTSQEYQTAMSTLTLQQHEFMKFLNSLG